MPLAQIGMHVGAAAVVLVVTFIFFARGWIGGGDAKLAAATALWLGFEELPELPHLRVDLRRHSHACDPALPRHAALHRSWRTRIGRSALHRMDTGVPYGIALALAASTDLSPHTLDEARHVSAAVAAASLCRMVAARVVHSARRLRSFAKSRATIG